MLNESWPGASHGELAARVERAETPAEFHDALERLFKRVHRVHPGAHFWVKDAQSHFLAVCSNFLRASELDRATLLSGINDVDSRLPWMRQGPLYVRDDREVFRSGVAKLDIVERQDRDDETIWLKTSKVPYRVSDNSSGGTVGGFERIDAKEAWRLSRNSAES